MYDEERIVMVSDWYHQSENVQMKGLMGAPFKWIGNYIQALQDIVLRPKNNIASLLGSNEIKYYTLIMCLTFLC